ncbi:MAG: response regulator [Mariprofundaceae bacterium]
MSFHIIDDEPAVREILDAFISHDGYETLCFDSAEAYLEHFSSPEYVPPIAILTDYMMPGMKGYALVKHIRQRAPYQKIAIVSGTADADHEANTELCYMLHKPFTRDDILSFIHAMAACEDACIAGVRCYAHSMCEFGLKHPCPFAPSV